MPGSRDAATARPDAYLIAWSMQHAHATAQTDWGWQRVGKMRYRNAEGLLVEIIAGAEDLIGRRGALLYLGYNWFSNPDYRRIDYMIGSGFVELCPHPENVHARS